MNYGAVGRLSADRASSQTCAGSRTADAGFCHCGLSCLGKGNLYHLLWSKDDYTTNDSFVPSKLIFRKRRLLDEQQSSRR